jgi:hypothetical protein
MAKSKPAPQSDAKRGPGRPKAMPDEPDFTNHMVRVAQDVPDLIGELAKAQGRTRGQVVTLLVRQAAQKRAKAAAKRAAKA